MRIDGVEEMMHQAKRFALNLVPREHGATVIALSGELGAGKTTFAQGVAAAFGVDEQVTSPTFVIEKIYQLERQKFARLIHIDAYRLKSAHELEILGWRELLGDSSNVILIEWPEMVASLVPGHAVAITLSGSGDQRDVEISYGKK